MNLELKKFDMSEITSDKVVVLIGKRNTGKSFLVKVPSKVFRVKFSK